MVSKPLEAPPESTKRIPEWFPVTTKNSYGRGIIEEQMKDHDRLIENAPPLIENKLEEKYVHLSDVMRRAERYKLSYNLQKKKNDDDILMANLIRDATTRCDDHIDAHVLRFREHRRKHPSHEPSWLEKQTIAKTMEVHDEVIKKAQKWVDDEPPHEALHYRQVLRQSQYTKGGVPRIACMPVHARSRRPRKASLGGSLLPERRGSPDPAQRGGTASTEMSATKMSRRRSATPSPLGSSLGARKRPHWALSSLTAEDWQPRTIKYDLKLG